MTTSITFGPMDLFAEPPNPFFDPARISRAIFDPRKNFLKTIWQKGKPVLDSELNEREDIDNFIRRQIFTLLAGEITIVKGMHPQQTTTPNKLCFTAGEIVVRGWDLIVEKNEGGYPSVNQNFNVVVVVPGSQTETVFPLNGLGFNPNINFDQPVGDNNTTILARGTHYDPLSRKLSVELENTCSLGPITYRIETVDGIYAETSTISPQLTHVFQLEENLINCVTLPVGPSQGAGTRTDYVYLQVGEVEICPTVAEVKRNGHISHPESVPANIFDPVVGYETTRRSQIQFDIRACAGSLPTPPHGFYIYPLYSVVRRPGVSAVSLEDVTTIVPMIDLYRYGLFDLIIEGAQLTHNTVMDINDFSIVAPVTVIKPVGSSVNIRNIGPANSRIFNVYGETFTLRPGESKAINFEKVGAYNLVDAVSGQNLAVITIVPWGSGGGSSEELAALHCAIGVHYFPDTGPLHGCDDSETPAQRSEQSLDVRIESLVFDLFELALCLEGVTHTSVIQLTYLFVDTFRDLNHISPTVRAALINQNVWNQQDNSFVAQ